MIANIAAGPNTAISSLGLPVDLVTGALNLVPRGINAVAGTNLPTIQDPIGGSASIKRAMGVVGANPDNVVANTPTERVVRAAGEGLTGMIMPGGIVVGLERAGVLTAAQAAAALGVTGGMTPSNAAMGAAAGVGSDQAQRLVPDAYKPLAGLAGGVLAGGIPAAAMALGTVGKNALVDIAGTAGMGKRNVLADIEGAPILSSAGYPLNVTDQQAAAAGSKIAGAATDLASVRTALGADKPALVPGSMPTSFQLTGDQGLGQLERGVSKAPEASAAFQTRAAQQNEARVNAVQSLAPAQADAADIGRTFRQQLDNMTTAQAQRETDATVTARNAVSAIGGEVPAGADTQATALQGFGQVMRGNADAGTGIAGQNAAAKVAEGKLWDAIDPDGSLAVDMAAVKSKADEIRNSIGPNAKPLAGEEAAILDTARDGPPVQGFRDLKDMRSRITDALPEMRKAGDAQGVRRMSMLLDSVHDSMGASVEKQAGADAAAVASGTMAPDQTIMARAKEQFEQWRAPTQGANSGGVGSNAPGGALGGLPELERASASASSGQGAFGGNPGLASVQADVSRSLPPGFAPTAAEVAGLERQRADANPTPPSGQLTFDAAADARYQAARDATRERHATFTNAPGVGAILKPGRMSGEFALDDSRVPAAIFTGGPGAAEKIQAFMAAGGNRPELVGALKNYAAFDLRRSAETSDGTLDPAKFAKWSAGHTEAMASFPELQHRFSTAADASNTLADVAAEGKAQRDNFQKSAAGQFLGDADPAKKVASILGSSTAQAQMADLAQRTANAPDARAGLQRAVVEHIMSSLKGDKMAGNTGTTQLYGAQLQKFVRLKGAALEQVFTPEQMSGMRNIAADIQRSDRSVTGNRMPGDSTTVENALAAAGVAKRSLLSTFIDKIAAPAGGGLGAAVAGPTGAIIGGAAGSAVTGLRAAGVGQVDQLVTEAMLNPALMRTLLTATDAAGRPAIMKSLGMQLGRLAVNGTIQGEAAQQRQPNSLAGVARNRTQQNAMQGAGR